jgi:hypothetical protein
MMAVLLVAIFPILLMINSQLAWLGLSVGISLLYYDSRQARPQAPRSARRRSSAPARATKRTPIGVAQLRGQA